MELQSKKSLMTPYIFLYVFFMRLQSCTFMRSRKLQSQLRSISDQLL